MNAGNVTLVDHSVTYHFRVSAAVFFEDSFNEGELSLVTPSAALFVPKPSNLHASRYDY